MPIIWGKYDSNPAEQIDTFRTLEEAKKMLAEYKMAFGLEWELWIGTKDEPKAKED